MGLLIPGGVHRLPFYFSMCKIFLLTVLNLSNQETCLTHSSTEVFIKQMKDEESKALVDALK